MEAAILVIFGPIHRGMVLGELPGLPVTWPGSPRRRG